MGNFIADGFVSEAGDHRELRVETRILRDAQCRTIALRRSAHLTRINYTPLESLQTASQPQARAHKVAWLVTAFGESFE